MSSTTRIAAARALATRSTRPLAAQPWYATATALRPYSSTSSSPSSSPSPLSSASTPSTSTSTSAPSPSVDRPTAQPQPTNLPGSNLPGAGKYSPLTVSIVTKVAKLFGYHSQTSTAIRTTSDYYDRCAERGEIEAPFFYEGQSNQDRSHGGLLRPNPKSPDSAIQHDDCMLFLASECSLPPSFQTWFSVTTLHVWLLSVRFRSLPPPLGRAYVQELINHFFIDVELRIRGPYAVTQSKLIKGYMKDMLEQYHGSCAAYDEGLISNDAVLAAALWRNVFGAGWGGVGGVKGKRAPKTGEVPKLGPNPNPFAVDPVQTKVLKKDQSPSEVFTTDSPIIDPKRVDQTPLYPDDPDLEFAISLEKMVRYIRREVMRMERLPDQTVMLARPPQGPGSLVEFTRF